jgi:hypothetical protein
MSYRFTVGADTPPSPLSHSRDQNITGTNCPNVKEFARLNRCSELKWLQFELVSSDGGQFSEDYRCEYMLDNDASVYCTLKKENTNIILKIAESSSFVLTHILIKAPETGFTCPIGSGLIFVYDDLPSVDSTSRFDSFSPAKYRQYMQSKIENNERINESDPALFFDLRDGWYTLQKLPIPRFGRYVLIKLIRSRNVGENVDIQYIGFKGFVGSHTFGYAELI